MNQIKGTHVPPVKNRSSKHIYFLTSHAKSIYRSMNNEELRSHANNGNYDAVKELNRRTKKNKTEEK